MKKKGYEKDLASSYLLYRKIREKMKNMILNNPFEIEIYTLLVKREVVCFDKIIVLEGLLRKKGNKNNIKRQLAILDIQNNIKSSIEKVYETTDGAELKCDEIDKLFKKNILEAINSVIKSFEDSELWQPMASSFAFPAKHQVCIELASTSQYTLDQLLDQYDKLHKYMNDEKTEAMLNEAVDVSGRCHIDLDDTVNSIIQMIKIFR